MGIDFATRQLIEPQTIIPTFCHGIAHIDIVGGNMHLALYVEQPGLTPGDETELLLNMRVIIPIAGVAAALPLVRHMLTLSPAIEPIDNGRPLAS